MSRHTKIFITMRLYLLKREMSNRKCRLPLKNKISGPLGPEILFGRISTLFSPTPVEFFYCLFYYVCSVPALSTEGTFFAYQPFDHIEYFWFDLVAYLNFSCVFSHFYLFSYFIFSIISSIIFISIILYLLMIWTSFLVISILSFIRFVNTFLINFFCQDFDQVIVLRQASWAEIGERSGPNVDVATSFHVLSHFGGSPAPCFWFLLGFVALYRFSFIE